MHVTGGQYKGYKIIIPTCAKPTLSKVREGVFNVLFSYFNGNIENLIFLDLFSGSGIMSIEANSRGYKTISIDKNPHAIKLIKENFKNIKEKGEIILIDSIKYLEKTDIKADIIYIDPPWDMDYEKIILSCYEKFKGGILIIESDKKRAQNLGEIYAKITAPFKEKVYGRCKLDFIKAQ